MIVVSDTSPINYLVLIEQIGRLHDLYGSVVVPGSVLRELEDPASPTLVRSWLVHRPGWLEVAPPSTLIAPELDFLGEGERDAIMLAEELGADGLLIDDRDGRREAEQRDLRVIGTLGVLAAAADKGLLNLPDAIERLKATTFRASPRLYEAFLKRFEKS